jgi:transposase-like protein
VDSEEANGQNKPNMSIEPPKPKKRYDEAFKRSAVEHWRSSGKKASVIAAELGVSVWNLRDWKKRYGPPPGPAQTFAQLEAENRTLRQELLRVQQQRDILKKSLGILVEPEPNASKP